MSSPSITLLSSPVTSPAFLLHSPFSRGYWRGSVVPQRPLEAGRGGCRGARRIAGAGHLGRFERGHDGVGALGRGGAVLLRGSSPVGLAFLQTTKTIQCIKHVQLCQTSYISRTLVGNKLVDHLDVKKKKKNLCSWSIACRHCSNYIHYIYQESIVSPMGLLHLGKPR